MKHWLMALLTAFTIVTGLSACDESLAYSHYEHTQLAGWEKSDTLYFNTPRMRQKGRYRMELGLRTTGDYPFTSLTLSIEQRVFPAKSIKNYSIKCKLMEENGVTRGQGVSVYQFAFPVAQIRTFRLLSHHIPAGINAQEYEQQQRESPKRGTTIAEEWQRNTYDGCQSQDHPHIDKEMEQKHA